MREKKENIRAVRFFGGVLSAIDFIKGKHSLGISGKYSGKNLWPVTSGSYVVGNPKGSLAVCTLTSGELMNPLSACSGVAIAGRLVTVNLGIEKIIRNVISNPDIRYLMICGKDSKAFQTSQGLNCLFANGVDGDKRIIGASGHYPVLKNIGILQIEQFLDQCELLDYTGKRDSDELKKLIEKLTSAKIKNRNVTNSKDYLNTRDQTASQNESSRVNETGFKKIFPGGPRESLVYDPEGFFVITIDRKSGEIIIKHYLPDNTPAHEMRGRTADSILRGLLREKIISQMSHAGYLGTELTKAETALKLNLQYEQDRPLRNE